MVMEDSYRRKSRVSAAQSHIIAGSGKRWQHGPVSPSASTRSSRILSPETVTERASTPFATVLRSDSPRREVTSLGIVFMGIYSEVILIVSSHFCTI
jgi:hypothetical protein